MPETHRRAKIVATIGPASRSERVLRSLLRAGMDTARLNFSHGEPEEHRRTAAVLRKLAQAESRPLAILQDLQGPKLRVGPIPQGSLQLVEGNPFVLTTRRGVAEPGAVSVSYTRLPREVSRGDAILLDDGLLRLTVTRAAGSEVHCRVITGGPLTSRKGINIPGRRLSIPALTAKDRRDLTLGLELGVDYVALSFVRDPQDLVALRRFLNRHKSPARIIAKLEKPQAVENLLAIMEMADGIMVARGDLGVELPPEQVPLLQKRMIREARKAGKPVITATQMLESMVENARPTRAEASDVANAILDGTDAVMLSAESAVGRYPVETVAMMDRIIRATEASSTYRALQARPTPEGSIPDASKRVRSIPGRVARLDGRRQTSVEDAVAGSAADAAEHLGARAIAVFTSSGSTARRVSRQRPHTPLAACTPDPVVYRQLALVWGVVPVQTRQLPTTDEMVAELNRMLRARRIVKKGELVVITAGTPVGRPGTTNFMKIHTVE